MSPPPVPARDPAADPLVGRVFAGRFELLQRLDQGGMGAVYRARQLSVGREVAIKVLHPTLAGRDDVVARFKREARTLCQVDHPAIVTLIDFGESETGELFLVMELLTGETLGAMLRREGALSPERAIHLARLLAEALDAAHQRNIIHRDLKPENLWLPSSSTGSERLKVLDFGIARSVDSQTTLTGPGVIFGTPAYMAPEMIAGRAVGPAADLYAVGCILFQMLVGHPPFVGASAGASVHSADSVDSASTSADPEDRSFSIEAMFAAHLFTPPPPLPDHIPGPLRELVHRLLQKAPEDRPRSAAELIDALDAVRDNAAVPQIRTAMNTSPSVAVQPRRWLVPSIAIGVVALVVSLVVILDVTSKSASSLSGADTPAPTPYRSSPSPSAEPSGPSSGGPTGLAPALRDRPAVGMPTPTPTPTPAPATTPSPSPSPTPAPATTPSPAPAPEPKPTTITLTLESTPPSTVTLDGAPAGNAPGTLELPQSTNARTLRFARAGHAPTTRRVIPDHDQTLRVRLQKVQADEWLTP